ncbi:hypothetical protein FQA39_LY18704 [Lamprigera yunnana]|nr:hypothetical protein FQA39_LY18704 [Lamprigera yunnana]
MQKNIAIVFASLFLLGSCDKKNEKIKDPEGKTKKDVIFAIAPRRKDFKNICWLKQTGREKGDTLAQLDVPEVRQKSAQATRSIPIMPNLQKGTITISKYKDSKKQGTVLGEYELAEENKENIRESLKDDSFITSNGTGKLKK